MSNQENQHPGDDYTSDDLIMRLILTGTILYAVMTVVGALKEALFNS